MSFEIFTQEDRQHEREQLASYCLDVAFFDKMGFRIKQIVPEHNYFRIETNKGFYCLKKMSITNEDMSLIQQLTKHLAANGFVNTFEILRHQNGETLVEYDKDQYYLTYWMDGRECDYISLLDIKEAIEALASFHISSEGFEPKAPVKHRRLYGRWQEAFSRRLEEIKTAKELILAETNTETKQIIINYINACEQLSEVSISYTESIEYKRVNERDESKKGFIHHEYGMHNILHTFDGRTFIGGLESFAFDIRMHDLGYIMFRLMRRRGWDMDLAMSIIDFYGSIYKLQKEDYQALAAYLAFPHDFRQLYKLLLVEGREAEDLEELDRINIESDYNICRQTFVNEFSRYAGSYMFST